MGDEEAGWEEEERRERKHNKPASPSSSYSGAAAQTLEERVDLVLRTANQAEANEQRVRRAQAPSQAALLFPKHSRLALAVNEDTTDK